MRIWVGLRGATEASRHLRTFTFFRDHDPVTGVSGQTTGQCLPSLLLRTFPRGNRKRQGREKGNKEEEGAGAHLCS